MPKSVIIQNFFRSGGSYLYNGIVENNTGIDGYYEPFHEHLVNPAEIRKQKQSFESTRAKLRHPNKQFYYDRFPLDEHWFNAFHQSNRVSDLMSCLPGQMKLACRQYLETLIGRSIRNSSMPVFKVNRAYFFPEAVDLKDVLTVFLFRDPVPSFYSNIYLNRLHAVYDMASTAARNNFAPFTDLWSLILDAKLNQIIVANNKFHFMDKRNLDFHYSVFYFLWLLGLERNLSRFEFVCNYDQLAKQKYRDSISAKFAEKANLNLGLGSFRTSASDAIGLKPALRDEVVELIERNIDLEAACVKLEQNGLGLLADSLR